MSSSSLRTRCQDKDLSFAKIKSQALPKPNSCRTDCKCGIDGKIRKFQTLVGLWWHQQQGFMRKLPSFVGQKIHALVRTLGFESLTQIPTSLVKLYSAGGDISSARQVLDETPEKQKVVLWMAMIAGSPRMRKLCRLLRCFENGRGMSRSWFLIFF